MNRRRQITLPSHSRALAALTALVFGAWSGAGVASANGTTWYAGPASTVSSGGSCPQATPCSLAYAISLASAGDTVTLLPGTYNVTSTVSVAKAITIEGDPGKARPSLVGTPSLASDVLTVSAGATARHLDIQTGTGSSGHHAALVLDGASAEDITAAAGSGDTQGEAILVEDSPSGTRLRTVLATSAAPSGSVVLFQDSPTGAGTASVLNVTAVSAASSTDAVAGNILAGAATVRNLIAAGASPSIWRQPGTRAITVSFSDFATATPGAIIDGGGNSSRSPVFVNAQAGDYHEAAGSPTIAAGSSSTAMSPLDLDGSAWLNPPDMGAYQYGGASPGAPGSPNPTGAGGTAPTSGWPRDPWSAPVDTGTGQGDNMTGSADGPAERRAHGLSFPHPSAPVAGVSVTLRPTSGTVLVELPQMRTAVRLSRAAQLPVGTVIDTTHGAVTLVSALTGGGITKSGHFTGGAFAVLQSRTARPVTTLALVGGSFARACTVHGPLQLSGARARRPSHRVVRQLWGSDHGGRFVTIGRGASAAVRGTVWLTQDRCDGTLVKVLRGRVVVHDDRRHRNVLVTAGHAYLARVGR